MRLSLSKYIFGSIVCLLIICIPSFSYAKGYQLKLFYNTEKDVLRKDKFVENPVSITQENPPSLEDLGVPSRGEYKVRVFSPQYKIGSDAYFDVETGAFTFTVPYFPHAERIEIITPSGNIATTFDVSQFAQCNQNNVCEYEEGETQETCPADCSKQIRTEPVQFSSETKQKLQAQNGVIRNEKGTVLLEGNNTEANEQSGEQTDSSQQDSPNIWFLIGGIVLFVAAVGSWIYIRFVRDEE